MDTIYLNTDAKSLVVKKKVIIRLDHLAVNRENNVAASVPPPTNSTITSFSISF